MSDGALDLRMLNVIGYGFDAASQPDAERYGFLSGQTEALRTAIRSVFDKILACVEHFKHSDAPITWMHVPQFGCGAFAGNRRHEVLTIWKELYDEFEPIWRTEGCTATHDNIYPSPNGEYFAN